MRRDLRNRSVTNRGLRPALRIALALALTAFVTPQASAAMLGHPFLFTFGPDGTAATKFSNVEVPAVDQGTHDVYVPDSKSGEEKRGIVYRFTSTGAPHNFTQGPFAGTSKITGLTLSVDLHRVAVAPPGSAGGTAGDLYIASGKPKTKPGSGGSEYEEVENVVKVFSPTGALLGELDGSSNPNSYEGVLEPTSVAVDDNGDLYVAYFSWKIPGVQEAHIDKYVPSGGPISNADYASTTPGPSCIWAVTAEGPYTQRCGDGLDPSIDPTNEDLYLGSGFRSPLLRQFNKEGDLISVIEVPDDSHGTSFPNEPHGVGIDESGRLYVASRNTSGNNSRVRVYGPGVPLEPPTASIDPVSNPEFESAQLTGTAGSGDSPAEMLGTTKYSFSCVPDCGTSDGTVPTDGADHAVSASLSDLSPATSYEVTLKVENFAGTTVSTTSFETPAKPPITEAMVTIDPVSEITATSAHLSGTVDPGGTAEIQKTTYWFEISSDGLLWRKLRPFGPITGEGPQPVSFDAEGLDPNAGYQVRLVAENAAGKVTSAAPNPTFTTHPAAPAVEATGATDVHSDSAQLNARIEPHNAQTAYYFQWGTGDCASNPCASAPASQDGDAGSGSGSVFVKAQVSGLGPSTTYSYRVIAKSADGETVTPQLSFKTEAVQGACPNEALRSGSSAQLPDCRAYELVSPVSKNGGNVGGLPTESHSSADGDAVSYKSSSGFADAPGVNAKGAEYVSRRGPEGWSVHGITPQHEAPLMPSIFADSNYVGIFSPDLSQGIFRSLTPIPGVTTSNVAGVTNLYLGSNLGYGDPEMRLLSESFDQLGIDVSSPNTGYVPHIALAGASTDLSHVLFESTDNLTPDASGEGEKLYESVDGVVSLAGLVPPGGQNACGPSPLLACEPASSSMAGAGAYDPKEVRGAGSFTFVSGVISRSGSRVFLTSGPQPDHGNDNGRWGALYMRTDATTTVRIDAGEQGQPTPEGPGPSEFQWATPSGDRVLFLSGARLLPEDVDSSVDLYEYRTGAPAGERLRLLSRDGTSEDFPAVEFVAGASEDGEYVYFAGSEGDQTRLYLLHSGMLRRVAQKNEEQDEWGQEGTLAPHWIRVSADGRHALISSREDQGFGYDDHGPGCERGPYGDLLEGRACAQLYLYSAASDDLACISCDFGAVPRGDASFYESKFPRSASSTSQSLPQPLTASGRRVFFDSPDPLVPEDTNGKYDVYEYDAESGEPALLSSGQCNCDSYFEAASPSGDDVFIDTEEQLVRIDTDDLYDIYDVRVGGGFASQNRIAPAECEGDACQATPTPPPASTPSSAAFNAPGNSKRPKGSSRKPRCRHGARKGKHAQFKRERRCGKAKKRPARASREAGR